MNLKFVLFVFLLLAFNPVAFALTQIAAENVDGVNFYRAAPENVFVGSKFWVTLVIENPTNLSKEVIVKEKLGDAEFDLNNAISVDSAYKTKFWNYEWKLNIDKNKSIAIVYWLIPKNVGEYVFSPSEVLVGNTKAFLASQSVSVNCVSDSKCDLGIGENYLTCPQDCDESSEDGTCNALNDGKCDADCEQGFDEDCETIVSQPTEPADETDSTQSPTEPTPKDNSFLFIGIIAVFLVVSIGIWLMVITRNRKSA